MDVDGSRWMSVRGVIITDEMMICVGRWLQVEGPCMKQSHYKS